MTSKQQAKQLLDKFYIICQEYTEEIQCSLQAKECAILHCDLIGNYICQKYWNEVKIELKKL